MSPPEVALWQQLRLRPHALKFRHQHPIGPYVADFYCASARLVIEIDGGAHDMGDNPERDDRRDARLRELGYKIIRIPAAEVMRNAASAAEAVATHALFLNPPQYGEGDRAKRGGGGSEPVPT